MTWEWILAAVLIVLVVGLALVLRSRSRLAGLFEPRDLRLMREAVQEMRRSNTLMEKKVQDMDQRLARLERGREADGA